MEKRTWDMIEQDKIIVIEFFKKWGGWVIAVILFLNMFACGGNSHAEVIALRDKENKTLKYKVDSLLYVNKSKDKLILASEKKVANSENKIHDLNKQILSERVKGAKEISKVKNYGLAEWKKFYQERSGFGDKDISLQSTTVNFTKEPLVVIANNLINGEIAKTELKLKNGVIAEKDTIIFQKDKIISTEREKGVNLTSALTSQKMITENLESNVSDLKNDLKKSNRAKTKSIIIATILGGITGAIIAK